MIRHVYMCICVYIYIYTYIHIHIIYIEYVVTYWIISESDFQRRSIISLATAPVLLVALLITGQMKPVDKIWRSSWSEFREFSWENLDVFPINLRLSVKESPTNTNWCRILQPQNGYHWDIKGILWNSQCCCLLPRRNALMWIFSIIAWKDYILDFRQGAALCE